MSVRPIVFFPDARLRLVSKVVEQFDDGLLHLMDDMVDTMYAAQGIGLAAIQIGDPRRVAVIDVGKEGGPRQVMRIINPQILSLSSEMGSYREGCLSLPECYEFVERPTQCTVSFLDESGLSQALFCEGGMATVMQHEIDHLDGILFIDHLSKLKRDMIIRKRLKAKRRQQAD